MVLAGGASEHSSRAYGAELVRFAESTPLLLLEGPGWRVEDVYEAPGGPYRPRGSAGEGSMEFVTGEPIPDENIRSTQVGKPEHIKGSKGPVYVKFRAEGMLPPTVRQRKAELRLSRRPLASELEYAHEAPHIHGQHWVRLPVLGATAEVDTRAEWFVNQGGRGNRQMTAYWSEDGYLLELRAAVPDLAAFEERLRWLTKVDSQTWLEAMPPQVVKAADQAATVREMLRGIPLPDSFSPSQVPTAGLTTNRAQVGAAVISTVSCLWFRQWDEGRRSGDRAEAGDAEKAMSSYRRWPLYRELRRTDRYPAEQIPELVAGMPSGHYEWRPGKQRRILPQVEVLGCARQGIPVLPWKQRRQSER
ncbi:MAG TPA: hypothetical protein VJQ84_03020 [Solirubrobacterales bacterium]|nr:hypothetical protein [Solirubrobacterales bacterium]